MAKVPLDRLSLKWKFPSGLEASISLGEATDRCLAQLHAILAKPDTDFEQRLRVQAQIRELLDGAAKAGEIVNAVDTAAQVAQVNSDNAKQPRPIRRKVDHGEVKPEYLHLIQSGMTERQATAHLRKKYRHDLQKTAFYELMKKIKSA